MKTNFKKILSFAFTVIITALMAFPTIASADSYDGTIGPEGEKYKGSIILSTEFTAGSGIKGKDIGLIFDISNLDPNTDYGYFRSDSSGNSIQEVSQSIDNGSIRIPLSAKINSIKVVWQDSVSDAIKNNYRLNFRFPSGVIIKEDDTGSQWKDGATVSDTITGADIPWLTLGKQSDSFLSIMAEAGYTNIRIKKVDQEGLPVSGVKFEILETMPEERKLGEFSTDSSGIIDLKDVKLLCKSDNTLYPVWDDYLAQGIGNELIIREIETPDGYETLPEDTVFKIEPPSTASIFVPDDLSWTEITIVNNKIQRHKVLLSKKVFGGSEVEGSHIKISSMDGTEILTWVSDNEGGYEFELAAGEYTLEEVVAPAGLARVTTVIVFAVDEEGVVTLKEANVSDEEGAISVLDNNHLVLEDKPLPEETTTEDSSEDSSESGEETETETVPTESQSESKKGKRSPSITPTGDETNIIIPLMIIIMTLLSLSMIRVKRRVK